MYSHLWSDAAPLFCGVAGWLIGHARGLDLRLAVVLDVLAAEVLEAHGGIERRPDAVQVRLQRDGAARHGSDLPVWTPLLGGASVDSGAASFCSEELSRPRVSAAQQAWIYGSIRSMSPSCFSCSNAGFGSAVYFWRR